LYFGFQYKTLQNAEVLDEFYRTKDFVNGAGDGFCTQIKKKSKCFVEVKQ